jgi:hypothetical protein
VLGRIGTGSGDGGGGGGSGRPKILCAIPACWSMHLFTPVPPPPPLPSPRGGVGLTRCRGPRQVLIWGIAGVVFFFALPKHHWSTPAAHTHPASTVAARQRDPLGLAVAACAAADERGGGRWVWIASAIVVPCLSFVLCRTGTSDPGILPRIVSEVRPPSPPVTTPHTARCVCPCPRLLVPG